MMLGWKTEIQTSKSGGCWIIENTQVHIILHLNNG